MVGVADRGTGIPPEDEARLFEKFYRGRSSVSMARVSVSLSVVASSRPTGVASGQRIDRAVARSFNSPFP